MILLLFFNLAGCHAAIDRTERRRRECQKVNPDTSISRRRRRDGGVTDEQHLDQIRNSEKASESMKGKWRGKRQQLAGRLSGMRPIAMERAKTPFVV